MVAYALFVAGAGTVTPVRMYNCTVSRTADGDYDLTIGNGGVDGTLMMPIVTLHADAAGGAGTARIPNVSNTSDTVKRIQIRDDTGTLVWPGGVFVKIEKMPPLPTP